MRKPRDTEGALHLGGTRVTVGALRQFLDGLPDWAVIEVSYLPSDGYAGVDSATLQLEGE